MLRALAAGILVSVACAIVGTFVVLRGLAFIGDALAHGVLPGVAVALILGVPGILGAAVGALVMIGGISVVTARSRLSSDSAIGLLFVGMLALGVVIVSRSTTFSGDLIRILFGEILGIGIQELLVQVAGFPARRYHNLMLLLVATTVIVSFQTVGTLLVFGMLLAPASAGALLAHRIGAMMAVAAVLGIASSYLGLLLSYYFNTAAGATIVLVATIIFFVVLVVVNARSRLPAPDEVES